jgi:DNA-binding MarR family transcriptional regulator
MNEKEMKYFEDSILYAIGKTELYCRIKGAQFFASHDFGVTLEQFCILELLSHSDATCQRDLSKRALKDRSNVSRILNILEQKGLIERQVDTKQKRLVKKVSITQKGRELFEEIIPILRERFTAHFEDITDEELATTKRTLEKLRINLSKDTTIQI